MRVSFLKHKQRDFINKILTRISVKKAASLCNLSERTIRDWRRERFLADLDSLRKLCKKTRIKFPSKIKLRNDYWYVAHSSILGAKAVIKKHGCVGGDPEYRKKKWREWWEEEGKFKNNVIFSTKPIKRPQYSKKLSEFTGIMLGDGGISHYQITVSLNSQDDKDYSNFVKELIENLFNVPVSRFYCRGTLAMRLIVSRKELVRFCQERLGLKLGNKLKQGLVIPNWIFEKSEFQQSCLRGLIDTDGCVFNERHKRGGKIYSYKRLNFTSYSSQLRNQVVSIFQALDMSPKIRGNRSVQIENKHEIQRYFELIGTHNPKHLKRYYNNL